MRNVLDFNGKEYGPEHLNTINARINLAFTVGSLNRLEEAEELAATALRQFERVVGPDHERTRYAQALLGQLRARSAAAISDESAEGPSGR